MRKKLTRRDVIKASAALGLSALGTSALATRVLAAGPAPVAITPELVDAAKKEGKVILYSSMDLPVGEKLGKAFEAKYPDMEVQIERSGSERLFQRLNQEFSSNIRACDVVNSSDASHFISWKRNNWLAPFVTEDIARHFLPAYRDPEGLFATFLPLIHDASSAGDLTAGEFGSLLGHVARKNDHWRLEPSGESLVIVHGPDGYISPGWYASKREHGRVVPTWNYLTAHIHGELLIHDDPVWLEALVRRLTTRHEASRAAPWSVDDAPRDYIAGQLRAIVGVELRITRVEAKAKLGQNRSTADIDGVIDGLRTTGIEQLAAATAGGRRDQSS